MNNRHLTHVFIAQAEYLENQDYYEELAETLKVVVIAEREFMLSRSSRLLVIHKPFFVLSVVNLLNGEVKENGFGEAQAAGHKPFLYDNVRVLAVDDEEMNLKVAKGVLGSYNIQVDTCLSGKEAIERCATTAYDIIFLDHMMPGFDGIETLKHIREMNNGMYQDLPVVALTANTISGAREMFKNEGFTEFIPKPIERAVLERVLRKVLPMGKVQHDETAALSQDLPENREETPPEESPLDKEASKDTAPRKKLVKKARLKKKALRKNVQGKSKREEAVRKTEETSGNKEAYVPCGYRDQHGCHDLNLDHGKEQGQFDAPGRKPYPDGGDCKVQHPERMYRYRGNGDCHPAVSAFSHKLFYRRRVLQRTAPVVCYLLYLYQHHSGGKA